MSLIFVDGFDHYDDVRLKWVAPSILEDPVFADGRCGGQALQKQFQNGFGIRRNIGIQAEVVVGMAIYTSSDSIIYELIPFDADEATAVRQPRFPTDELLTFIDSVGTVLLTIKFVQTGLPTSGTGKLEVESPVVGLTPSVDNLPAWSTEQWRYLQFKYKPNGTAGLIEIVDGTGSLLYRAEGKTTNEADNDVATIQLMGDSTNDSGYRVDDLYVLNTSGTTNNDYLGDIRVTPFALRSVLSQQSTGDVSFINEEVMDTITKNTLGVVGAFDNYEVQGFACHGFTPTSVKGIQYNIGAAKDNAGSIKYQHSVNSIDSGVDIVAPTFAGGNFNIGSITYDTDPADSGAWTEAKIEALEVGFKLTVREGGA